MSQPPAHAPSIAVIGAGGVGGLLAALLARAGHDVRMLARGAALAAIRERGITVRGPDAEFTAAIARASDDPAALGAADIVLVTVKTWQLAELGPRLAPVTGDRALVVPMQNGVEASETLARSLGDDRVIGGVCRMIAWAERPGEIRVLGVRPSLTIGPMHAGQAAAVAACAEVLRAGIEVIVGPDPADIARARWLKFLFIAPYAALGAVEQLSAGPLRSAPGPRARLEAAMHEVAALAAARGVRLPPDAVAGTLRRIDQLPDDAIASMHRDILD
ncbi:MAG TPA: 2-dehydropantoate 2-reductase, partial [Kofleriaceae bacterium]|nr:2-dehydropantoate 2-reductase [Kofleriaceae bacterium]